MGLKPSLNPTTSGTQAVDELLGEAYRVVRVVEANLPEIVVVHDNMDTILTAAGMITDALPAVAAVAADKIAVAADRVAVEADRVEVAANTATVLTAVDTAAGHATSANSSKLLAGGYAADADADRVQTGLDRVAVAADKAAVDIAKGLVDTAKAAVDSQATSVATNKGLVDTAKAAVDVAKTAAELAETHAETAETNAAASAATATAQAGMATTQAGIATTKAGEASADRVLAQAAAAVAGGGFRYIWSTDTTASDPTTGKLKINAGATALYISETDKNGGALATVIATWDDSTTTATRSLIKISKVGDPAVYKVFTVTAALTDSGTYDTLTVALLVSNGTLTNGDEVVVENFRTGNQGATGAVGAVPAVPLTFSTTLTDADPGAGLFRMDVAAASIATVTKLFIDDVDNAGASIAAWLDTFDDSSSTIKGYIHIRGITTPAHWAILKVTDAVVNDTGYRDVPVAYIAGSGTFANAATFNVSFSPNGDAGTGAVSTVNTYSGAVVLNTDDLSDAGRTNKWATAAEKTKLGFISVTQAVDLDSIETQAAASKVKTDWISITQAVDLDAIETNTNASKTKTDWITVTQAVNLDTIETNSNASKVKTDYLTVTAATDLDTIRTRVNALDAAVTLQGGWAANAATFPGAGAAQAGASYIVTTAGTVNGIDFAVNDRLLAIVDNASTTVYAANWLKLDYTDQVLSVAGQTGAVTLAKADVGLGNVDNTSNATERAAAATLTNKTISGGANTITNLPTASMSDAAVTNVKLANMATATVKGRNTAGTGAPEDLTMAQLKVLLALVKADVGLSLVDNTSDATKLDNIAGRIRGRNRQTGTTYTFVLADTGMLVEGNNASAQTYTVPPNSSVAFPADTTVINLGQYGAGQIAVAAGVGVTIRSEGSKLKLRTKYSTASLIKIGTDEWWLFGDIAA